MFSRRPACSAGFLVGRESEAGSQFFHHSVRSEVAGEENQRPLEVDDVVVAQPQSRLVQDAKKQPVRDGAAFSISSNRMIERLLFSLVTEASFACVRIGWVSRCPR